MGHRSGSGPKAFLMPIVGDQEASSSSTPPIPHQVFLSFRGPDTRLNITSHLYTALTNAGCKTFIDDEGIERGEKIKTELERGIQQSTASIIVFSKGYASSKWCLDELTMILEKRNVSQHFVLPLFYHVKPMDVRHQKGTIGKSFAKHEEKVIKEANIEKKDDLVKKIEKWRAALTEAAGLSGIEFNNKTDWNESEFVKQVVEDVTRRLTHKPMDFDPNLVGMYEHTQDINLWIDDSRNIANIMLICGMGGIGKTTIAKKVYNDNYRDFECSSFLHEVREISKKPNGLLELQKSLFSDICKGNAEHIRSDDEKLKEINIVLSSKKVLLVVDDVDCADQLKAIFNMPLFPGSKIIVTTRNEQLKHTYNVERCKVHEVAKLPDDESVQLFKFHAFGRNHPIESYGKHVQKIVSHCQGLPLALKVLGGGLKGKGIDIWEDMIKGLETNPSKDIIHILKISFDYLKEDDVKNVFLYIACFFVGENKNRTIEILNACQMRAVYGIDCLVDLFLLENHSGHTLWMHQLIKDMGIYIVCHDRKDKLIIDPMKHSMLWRSEDCYKVLRKKIGTSTDVQALAYMRIYTKDNDAGGNSVELKSEEQYPSTSSLKRKSFDSFSRKNSNDMVINADGFSRMPNLIFIELSNVEVSGSYTGFPDGLRWLCWHRCQLKCMPSDLSMTELVGLEMQYSSLKQLWEGPKDLPALKILDLSHSTSLARSPDFSRMPNLERLILEGCSQLVELSPTVTSNISCTPQDLPALKILNLSSTSLARSPEFSRMPNLERLILEGCSQLVELRESIASSKKVVILNLKDCGKLRRLPRNISMLQSLEELDISGCSSLSEFPMGLTNLKSLKWFNANRIDMSALVSPAKGISCWASFPPFMEELSLENCKLTNDCFPKDFSNLSSLKYLNLSRNLITTLPDCCGSLSNLVFLDVEGCSRLESVVGLPIIIKRRLSEVNIESDKEFVGILRSEDYMSWEDCPRLAEIEGCYKRVSIRAVDSGKISKLGLMDLDPSLFESDLFNNVEVEDRCGTLGTFVPLDNLPERFNSISFPKSKYWDTSFELCVPHKGKRIQGLTLAFLYHERPDEFHYKLYVSNERKQSINYCSEEKSGVSSRDGGVVRLWHIDLWKPFLQPGDLIKFQIGIVGPVYPEASGIMIVEEEEDHATGFDLSLPFPFTSLNFSSWGTSLNGVWANECPNCWGDQIPEGKTVSANARIGAVCSCHSDSVNNNDTPSENFSPTSWSESEVSI